jgi:hypothetical protein
MNLAQRTTALLELVEQYRARRCGELLQPAHAEARAARRAALGDARRRVHTAIVEERKRYGAEVGAVEAALATDRRLADQRHAVDLLSTAWHELRARLVKRWDDPDTRKQWMEAHLWRALRTLPADSAGWLIETHPALTGAERSRIADHLRIEGIAPVRFELSPAITGGFRVISGRNTLDATIEGLLADRVQLEGRLLHHLEGELVR